MNRFKLVYYPKKKCGKFHISQQISIIGRILDECHNFEWLRDYFLKSSYTQTSRCITTRNTCGTIQSECVTSQYILLSLANRAPFFYSRSLRKGSYESSL